MKILLLKDLYYLDHLILESVRPPAAKPVREIASAGNEVRKTKGSTLEVKPDSDSEAAEHQDGSTWFILLETEHRFKIANEDFREINT